MLTQVDTCISAHVISPLYLCFDEQKRLFLCVLNPRTDGVVDNSTICP